ncbi:MAG: hypothetical protein IJ232_00515 [Lachnospiraceae bacterium]|nr:hypothetical protein [Lachnospiraceae bacterium]
MDEVVKKIAALGVPGLIFTIALATTGLSGAAAITAALAMLGPGGIVGGIAFLGVVGLITHAIAEFGSEKIMEGVIKELYLQGETKSTIKDKIKKYPISKKLKLQLNDKLDNFKI